MASEVEAACDSVPETAVADEGEAEHWSEEPELEDEELEELARKQSAIFDDIEAAEDHVQVESSKVSSQFERLEALLQAAQLREQVEEREDQACEEGREEGRERELDELTLQALEADRMLAISEEAAEATYYKVASEATDKAEADAEFESCAAEAEAAAVEAEAAEAAAEAAASTISACSSGARLFPGRSSPSAQAWSNDEVADVEVIIDDSEDEQEQSSAPLAASAVESWDAEKLDLPPPATAAAAELAESTRESADLDLLPPANVMLEETLPPAPKKAAADDGMRSHYLLLLERAAQQRRQLNDTLAEIKTVEETLGLAANATVATAPAGDTNVSLSPPAKRSRNG